MLALTHRLPNGGNSGLISLRFEEELSAKEIAKVIPALSSRQVYRKLYRILGKLRRWASREDDNNMDDSSMSNGGWPIFKEHLTAEELAQALEGRLPEASPEQEHLEKCPECLHAYSEGGDKPPALGGAG